MSNGLLAGLRVVELAHPLTEYAGLVWAGLGAEVLLCAGYYLVYRHCAMSEARLRPYAASGLFSTDTQPGPPGAPASSFS